MQLLWSFLRKASTFERSRRCSLRVLASPLVGTVQDGLGGWRYLIRDNCAAVRLVGSVDSAHHRIFGPQVRLGVHLACDAPRSRTCTLFGCLGRSWHVEMCPSQASCWRACRGVRSLSRSPKLWTTSARLRALLAPNDRVRGSRPPEAISAAIDMSVALVVLSFVWHGP